MEALDTADAVFQRYEAVRERLPSMPVQQSPPTFARDLRDVFSRYDAFILDGFGVLNVGASAIAAAAERVAQMRAAGKIVMVLTNAASYPASASVEKYRGLGFDFCEDEIVSSRDVALAAMAEKGRGLAWAATAAGPGSLDGIEATALLDDPRTYEDAEQILYLSGDLWTAAQQERLLHALHARKRPVVVANPDLVAPREEGFSVEPGAWAHALLDSLPGVNVSFYGKPFGNAFEMVLERLGNRAPPPERIAMVGDTLHTDILGGAAAGWGSILITRHGIFRGRAVEPFIAASQIVPSVICETT